MSFYQEDLFNKLFYDMLLPEDREIIDEYSNKMGPASINGFMQRFVKEYHPEEILEVSEDKDAVVVFEKNKALFSAANVLLVEFIDKFILSTKSKYDIEKFITNKNNAIFIMQNPNFYNIYSPATAHIKKYINSDGTEITPKIEQNVITYSFHLEKFIKILNTNNKNVKFLCYAVNKYFLEEYNSNAKNQIKYIVEKIREYFIEYAKNQSELIKIINNIEMPIKSYIYRDGKLGITINKLGIPLYDNCIPGGYSKNIKIDKKFVSIKTNDAVDLSKFVDRCCYWMPKNAISQGFNNKTGIIWFNAIQIDDKTWKFEDNSVIIEGTEATVDMYYVSDAFVKMLQRCDFFNKLKKFLLSLES